MRPAERARAALLTLRMLPWALAAPVLKRRLPAPRLVRLFAAGRRDRRPRSPSREREIARATWWASRVQVRRFPDNCLERSLLTYRYLGLAGAEPHLLMGVGREEGEMIGHAWVTTDGAPVHEFDDPGERYGRLIDFGPDGRPDASSP